MRFLANQIGYFLKVGLCKDTGGQMWREFSLIQLAFAGN